MKYTYTALRAPFPLDFKNMSKQQAKAYLIWFQEQIPERIILLSHFVQSFPEFHLWEADLSLASLDGLGNWFIGNVKTRKRTNTEISEIYSNAPGWFRSIHIPDDELTIETLSLSADLGMYVSQMLLHNIPSLRWTLGGKPINNVDYQQPVLAGSGKLVFNPVRMIITHAYGITQGKERPGDLRELYEIWENLLKEGY